MMPRQQCTPIASLEKQCSPTPLFACHVLFMMDQPSTPSSYANDNSDSSNIQQQCGSLTGQIMSAVKDGCRRAFMNQPQRLMAAMYNCSIQVSGEVVGK
jgi:ribosome assembly protein 1